MTSKSNNLLDFNNKQENNGADNSGRLTAGEFNRMVDAINNNSTDILDLQTRLGNITVSPPMTEAAYRQLEHIDENTLYLLIDE
jgi:hypothetical protein